MGFDDKSNDVAAANYLSRKVAESLGSEVIVQTKIGVIRPKQFQGPKSFLSIQEKMTPQILMEMAEEKSVKDVCDVFKQDLSSATEPSKTSPTRFFDTGNQNQFWYSTGHLMKTLRAGLV